MKLHHILNESINDKGLFHAIFLAGPPAAGKSTLIKAIYNGEIGPRVVDPDKIAEIMAKNREDTHGNIFTQKKYKDEFTQKKVKQITNFVIGMLPMFVDATGSDVARTEERARQLEALGYDTMMIWLGTDIFRVMNNMSQRQRQVPMDFIDSTFESLEMNFRRYQQFFGPYFYVHNNYIMTADEKADFFKLKELDEKGTLQGIPAARYDYLQDRFEQDANTLISLNDVREVTNDFLNTPVKNRYGQAALKYLADTHGKYLTDGVWSLDKIQSILSSW